VSAVILVDSSVWIDYFNRPRGGDSVQVRALDRLIEFNMDLALCGPVRMEVLQGVRFAEQLPQIEQAWSPLLHYPTEEHHFDQSAALYRSLRQRGITIRRSMDCLIASLALDHGLLLLAQDRDFRLMAQYCPLRLWPEIVGA
jgi:predicted nucleic acid-binding protein